MAARGWSNSKICSNTADAIKSYVLLYYVHGYDTYNDFNGIVVGSRVASSQYIQGIETPHHANGCDYMCHASYVQLLIGHTLDVNMAAIERYWWPKLRMYMEYSSGLKQYEWTKLRFEY